MHRPVCTLVLLLLITFGTGCVSVPPQVERELAPPDGTVPDHFRPRAPADARS